MGAVLVVEPGGGGGDAEGGVDGGGHVLAQTSMPGSGEILAAQLRLPWRGTRPLDRWLAPACTGITGLILAALLFFEWNDRRFKKPEPE